jgi:hypothetical protein
MTSCSLVVALPPVSKHKIALVLFIGGSVNRAVGILGFVERNCRMAAYNEL